MNNQRERKEMKRICETCMFLDSDSSKNCRFCDGERSEWMPKNQRESSKMDKLIESLHKENAALLRVVEEFGMKLKLSEKELEEVKEDRLRLIKNYGYTFPREEQIKYGIIKEKGKK